VRGSHPHGLAESRLAQACFEAGDANLVPETAQEMPRLVSASVSASLSRSHGLMMAATTYRPVTPPCTSIL
jgi:hypothetical protein